MVIEPALKSGAPRRLAILGATGSIGRSCAQVIAASPGRFQVESVAAGRDVAGLARAARDLGAKFAAKRPRAPRRWLRRRVGLRTF